MIIFFFLGLVGGLLGGCFILAICSLFSSFGNGIDDALQAILLFPIGSTTLAFAHAIDKPIQYFNDGCLSVILIQVISLICGFLGGLLIFFNFFLVEQLSKLFRWGIAGDYNAVIGVLAIIVCPILYCLIGGCMYQLARDHGQI